MSELLLDDDESKTRLLNQAKEIKIEDLLGRKPIEFNKEDIANLVKGKVCMVTGGAVLSAASL